MTHQDEDMGASTRELAGSSRGIATIVLEVLSYIAMLPFIYIELRSIEEYREDWFNAWNILDVIAYANQVDLDQRKNLELSGSPGRPLQAAFCSSKIQEQNFDSLEVFWIIHKSENNQTWTVFKQSKIQDLEIYTELPMRSLILNFGDIGVLFKRNCKNALLNKDHSCCLPSQKHALDISFRFKNRA